MQLRVLLALLLVAVSTPAESDRDRVRIGVFGLLKPSELVVRPAGDAVLLIEAGSESLVLESGQSLSLGRDGRRIRAATSKFMATVLKARVTGRRGGDAELMLSVPGSIERRYRGRLDVRVANGVLSPVIEMTLATAVASAVASESPPGAPLEALKAQAVASRSFYVASRKRHDGFDFCDTTHCQFLREPPAQDHPAAVAERATRDFVLHYGGKSMPALYTASCGGHTRTLSDVGLESAGYPYFRVPCAYCRNHAPEWKAELEAGPVAKQLSAHRSEQARLAAGRRMGWGVVPGNNYTTEWEGTTLLVRGRGRGHGVGLCQEGAAAMASAGANFRQILQHYYPNTTLKGR